MTRSRQSRSREAVRMDGRTWRYLDRLDGPCADCGRCDAGPRTHAATGCLLEPGWYAGDLAVCPVCLVHRIRDELGVVAVPRLLVLASSGDAAALQELARAAEGA